MCAKSYDDFRRSINHIEQYSTKLLDKFHRTTKLNVQEITRVRSTDRISFENVETELEVTQVGYYRSFVIRVAIIRQAPPPPRRLKRDDGSFFVVSLHG